MQDERFWIRVLEAYWQEMLIDAQIAEKKVQGPKSGQFSARPLRFGITHGGYVGLMWGLVGNMGPHGGYIGIMEKNMETTIGS